MKNILSFIIAISLSAGLFAQTPEKLAINR